MKDTKTKFMLKLSKLRRGRKENRDEDNGAGKINVPNAFGSTSKQSIVVQDDESEEGEIQVVPQTTPRPEELLGYDHDRAEDYHGVLQSPNLESLHLLATTPGDMKIDTDTEPAPKLTVREPTGSASPAKRPFDQELCPNAPTSEKKPRRRSRTPSGNRVRSNSSDRVRRRAQSAVPHYQAMPATKFLHRTQRMHNRVISVEERNAVIISATPTDRWAVDGFNERGGRHFGYHIKTKNTPISDSESFDTPMDGATTESAGGDEMNKDLNRPQQTKAEKKGKGKIEQTKRSYSPVTLRQHRFPRLNADLKTRMRLALLNYLQTPDLDTRFGRYSALEASVVDQQLPVPRTHSYSRDNTEIYRDVLPIRIPAYANFDRVEADQYLDARIRGDLAGHQDGAGDIVRVLGINIEGMSELVFCFSVDKEVKRRDVVYTFNARVFVFDEEGNVMNDAQGNEIRASISYSWEQSIKNQDLMHWADILFQLRRISKIDFDGFGEPRSLEEQNAFAEDFSTARYYGM